MRRREHKDQHKEKYKYKKDPMSSYISAPYNTEDNTKKSIQLSNISKYQNVQMTPKNADKK